MKSGLPGSVAYLLVFQGIGGGNTIFTGRPVTRGLAAGEPEQNLQVSLLYCMLRLNQRHPQPRVGMLPDNCFFAVRQRHRELAAASA